MRLNTSYARWGLAVLGALLPVAAIGMYSIYTADNSLRHRVQADNMAVDTIAGESLQQHLIRSQQMGQVVASFPTFAAATAAHDEKQIRERLRRLVEATPSVDRAFVLDKDGLLWCDWPVAPESLGRRFAYRDYYRVDQENWQPYISEVFQRQAAPQPLVIAISVPIFESNSKVVGILVVQHRLETLTGWLRKIGFGSSGEVVVLDHNGTMAGHSRLYLLATRHDEYMSLQMVQQALAGVGSSLEYNDPLTGKTMVASFQPVKLANGKNWVVIGQQERQEAYLAVAELRKHISLAIVVVAILAVSAAIALARISEHNRQMSLELADRNISLQQAVKAQQEANAALKKAQAQMVESEKMAGLGQMVAGVAHEINNPLSFVSNNVAVLQRDLLSLRDLLTRYQEADGELQKSRPQLMEAIGQMAQRMDLSYTLGNLEELLGRSREGLRRIQQIVKDLRDFARLDDNLVHEADLNAGVESTVNIIRGRAKKKDVKLELSLGEIAPVTCSLARINQVVMNLVSNAIDACSVGGVVTIRTGNLHDQVFISVRDNGCGIPPELRERIFDPFFTTKPQGEGVGLGLSISYGIARDHGGVIEVESTAGQGSTFTLRFPRQPAGTQAAGQA